MRKKITSLLIVMAACLSLAACGAKKTDDLTGTWKSEENDGAYQEATITEDTITINWVSDGGKTTSLYWEGTYKQPTESVNEYTWTSDGDKDKMSTALMASTDDTKDFSYKDGKISYETSAFGTTTTTELTKE